MAENVVDPLMEPEIILTENDVPGARLTKDLAEYFMLVYHDMSDKVPY